MNTEILEKLHQLLTSIDGEVIGDCTELAQFLLNLGEVPSGEDFPFRPELFTLLRHTRDQYREKDPKNLALLLQNNLRFHRFKKRMQEIPGKWEHFVKLAQGNVLGKDACLLVVDLPHQVIAPLQIVSVGRKELHRIAQVVTSDPTTTADHPGVAKLSSWMAEKHPVKTPIAFMFEVMEGDKVVGKGDDVSPRPALLAESSPFCEECSEERKNSEKFISELLTHLETAAKKIPEILSVSLHGSRYLKINYPESDTDLVVVVEDTYGDTVRHQELLKAILEALRHQGLTLMNPKVHITSRTNSAIASFGYSGSPVEVTIYTQTEYQHWHQHNTRSVAAWSPAEKEEYIRKAREAYLRGDKETLRALKKWFRYEDPEIQDLSDFAK